MRNYSLLIKHVVYGALVCCIFGVDQSPAFGQGQNVPHSLNKEQIDAIVKPELSMCSARMGPEARLDANSIIPTSSKREFPAARVAKTLNGMWHGQVIGSPLDTKYAKSKEANVDYFWIIDSSRKQGLMIALRDGKNSTAGIGPIPNAPKITYLICAHEGYVPNVEKGSEIHEFTKISDSIDDAQSVLEKATGLKFKKAHSTLTDFWREIVASGYFKSLPAVAFAGGFFSPMRIDLVPSPIGPAELSLSWDSEYYGGGTTWIKFTPGVPMKGEEYTQFVGTTATTGDYLVASPGNGKLAKVEARSGGDYDLAFDHVSFGPLQ